MNPLSSAKYYITILLVSCFLYPACAFGDDILMENGDKNSRSAGERLANEQTAEEVRTQRRAGGSPPGSPGGSSDPMRDYGRSPGGAADWSGSSGSSSTGTGDDESKNKASQGSNEQAAAQGANDTSAILFENATYENFEEREGKQVFDESRLGSSS